MTPAAKRFLEIVVREAMFGVTDDEVRAQAWEFMAKASAFADRHDLADKPRLHAIVDDGGALVVEWMFPRARLGMVFEKRRSESSWYWVSHPLQMRHGPMLNADVEHLLMATLNGEAP